MRDAMTRLRPKDAKPLAPLILSVWVTSTGAISKVEAATTGSDEADADLRTILLGKKLGTPPKAMLQPMKLAVQLTDKKAGQTKADQPK